MTEQEIPLVVFAVDAHSESGLGHVRRCVTTANAIARAHANVSVSVLAIDAAGMPQIGADSSVQVRSAPLSRIQAQPESVIPREDRELLLVLDHYGLAQPDWLRRFRGRLPMVPVLAFDDVCKEDTWPVLGVISPGIGAPVEGPEEYTKCFNAIGSTFFPMRDDIDPVPRPTRASDPDSPLRILVALGGADTELHTERIVKAVSTLAMDVRFDIVFGPGADTARAAASPPDPRFAFHHYPEDFPSLMRTADIALTGGGNTCHELLFLGVPLMAVCLAENQVPTCEALARTESGHYAGLMRQLSEEGIVEQLKSLIAHPARCAEMAGRGRDLVDGMGAKRLADFIVGTMRTYFSDSFSEDEVRNEYNESAAESGEHEKVRWGSADSMRNRMGLALDTIEWASVDDWADVGAATGLFLVLAEERTKIGRFVGIDLSGDLLDFAHSRAYSTSVISFERQSFMSAVAGEPFSLVTALGVLQKCGLSIERAMARIAQMTAAAGQVFLTTKNAAWHRFDERGFEPFTGHHWFDPARVKNACRWGGLDILSIGTFDAANNKVDSDLRAHGNLYVHARKVKW